MQPDDTDAANLINSGTTEADAGELELGIDESPGWVEEPATQRLTVEERFGRAVLRLRLYMGWSQRDLQRTCGVHQSQISRLETGQQHGLSSRRIFAILRALHVGEIAFLPPPTNPPTALELMFRGDPWERAGLAAEQRAARAAAQRAARAAERRVNRRRSA